MAHRFFGLNFGQTEFSVSDAATTQTKDVEVNVNLAAIPASENGGGAAVVTKLREIINYLNGKATTIT